MSSVNHTVRETGERTPAPTGDFDGMTKAKALELLLKKTAEIEAKS